MSDAMGEGVSELTPLSQQGMESLVAMIGDFTAAPPEMAPDPMAEMRAEIAALREELAEAKSVAAQALDAQQGTA